MKNVVIRRATKNDICFIAETIIEAEKAGTQTLPYTTLFGLKEAVAKFYVKKMLEEDIDSCIFSISSYFVAEKNSTLIGAVSAWVENMEGIPSRILKGNILNFILPKSSLKRAIKLNKYVRDIQIEYKPDTIQIGAGYVTKKNRGNNIYGELVMEQIYHLSKLRPDVTEVYDDMFGNNTPAIRAVKKLGFKLEMIKKSKRKDIKTYLPHHTKVVMKKDIT